MTHPHEATLLFLEAVLTLRSQLISLVLQFPEPSDLAAAWEVTSARFPILLATLSSPEFLEDEEERLMTLGISGAEATFRVGQFSASTAGGDVRAAVVDGASLLRTLAQVDPLNEACRAIADFCDGVSSMLTRQER
jgi:hypothetical protein